MLRYYCSHCSADLGPVVPDQPEPSCPDHPDGLVRVVIVAAEQAQAEE